MIFTKIDPFFIFFDCIIPLIFGIYLVIDTSLIIEGSIHLDLEMVIILNKCIIFSQIENVFQLFFFLKKKDDYIIGALMLYTDIV